MRISDWSSDVCSSDLSRSGGPQKEAAGPDGLANVVTLDSVTYDDRSAEMEHDQMGASSRNLGGERLLALFRDEHGTPAEIAARPVDAVLGPHDDAMRVALAKRPCGQCHVPKTGQASCRTRWCEYG